MSQRDLADRLHLSRPWVTKMLQSLEKEGAVVRRADKQDQRVTSVYLTQAGREREEELRTVWSDYLNETVGSLSDEDKGQLLRLIDLLSDRLSNLLSEAGGPHA